MLAQMTRQQRIAIDHTSGGHGYVMQRQFRRPMERRVPQLGQSAVENGSAGFGICQMHVAITNYPWSRCGNAGHAVRNPKALLNTVS